ncbi:hypothetical protein D3C71_1527390 [compost metagenome]
MVKRPVVNEGAHCTQDRQVERTGCRCREHTQSKGNYARDDAQGHALKAARRGTGSAQVAGAFKHGARSPAICRLFRRSVVCAGAAGIPVVLPGDGGQSVTKACCGGRWAMALSGLVVAV